MSNLVDQVGIEMQMYYGGVKRAETIMRTAEEKGRAEDTQYAQEIFDDYVLPLASAIRSACSATVGVKYAHVKLLRDLDPDTVAFTAVRTVVNCTMAPRSPYNHRSLAAEIGKAVHAEIVLAQLEGQAPGLYYSLVKDMGRRLSRNERYRLTVMKMKMQRRGVTWAEWEIGSRDQVGMYLLGLVEAMGLVTMAKQEASAFSRSADGRRPKKYCDVFLSQEVLKRVDEVKAHIAITTPVYGPCVEPPRDWVSPTDGGFHTKELRRTHSHLVRGSGSTRDIYRNAKMPTVLAAVNALQRTAWRVNAPILDVVLAVAKTKTVGEIVSLDYKDQPPRPSCADLKVRTEEQEKAFKSWKYAMSDWYTNRKLAAAEYGRFHAATRAADMFREYPAIYFVYFADTRGRLYPMTYGLNPQGSDLQKALIKFSRGLPIHQCEEATRWFKIHGANKFGYDKATLDDRVKWVDEREDELFAIGNAPLEHTGWQAASKPLQFLAWCMEYAAYLVNPRGFVSYLPVSMDGSCNGLQHLSAMMRDEVGGEATNLTANVQMRDIYGIVAERTTEAMREDRPETDDAKMYQSFWLDHGISRDVTKRPVMTTSYGVTRRRAVEYVLQDYLRDKQIEGIDPKSYRGAAEYLIKFTWPAIGRVVVKGRTALDWLSAAAKKIAGNFPDGEEPVITWLSPSGFPATQAYFDIGIHRIHTRMRGVSRIRVASELDTPAVGRHASGMAPNFVHSCDAAHLHLTTVAAHKAGMRDFAMVHDDFGVHAANAGEFYRIIRRTFVKMYEEFDPLADLHARYPDIKTPPTKGTLDIKEVSRSPFFFS